MQTPAAFGLYAGIVINPRYRIIIAVSSLLSGFDSLDDYLTARAPYEPEFHQAVREVMADVKPIIDSNSDIKAANIIERLTEPERLISLQIAW